MNKSLKTRLSIMSFLQVGLYGLLLPVLSLFLKKSLSFDSDQIAFIQSLLAISFFISPILGSMIADKLMSSRMLYTICHLIGGFVMLILAYQSNYTIFVFVYLLYMIFSGLTIPLCDAIIFFNLKDGKKDYSQIRIWGSLGWIGTTWAFSFFWLKGGTGIEIPGRINYLLYFVASLSFILSVFSFAIPKTKVKRDKKITVRNIFPLEPFKFYSKLAVFAPLMVTIVFALNARFFYFGGSLFLNQVGFSDGSNTMLMTAHVIPELILMFFLGKLIHRFGLKKLIITGMILQGLKYLILANTTSPVFIIIAFLFECSSYPFCTSAILIYIDSMCTKENRAGIHQTFTFIVYGVITFIGARAAGKVATLLETTKADNIKIIDYQAFWIIPAVLSALCIIWLFFTVKEDHLKGD